MQPLSRSARSDLPAPAAPAAPRQAGAYRNRREQWQSDRRHGASPAPPRFRTRPDVPATRSPASCADAPIARGHDAAAPSPVALPSSPAQIASSGAEPPRKSLPHRRRPLLPHTDFLKFDQIFGDIDTVLKLIDADGSKCGHDGGGSAFRRHFLGGFSRPRLSR